MKTIITVFFLLVAFIAPVGNIHAGEQDEKLKQLTTQLQGNPNNTALREEIIKLALTMKPEPTVPEEAERFDGRGEYAFKSAKTEADYLVAAQEFEKACNAAPWVASYYFNAGTAYEKANRPAEAKRKFELYLIASPNAQDTRDVRRRISGLEFAIEKANSPEAQAAKKREQEEAILRTLDGAMFREEFSIPTDRGGRVVTQVFTVKINGRQATYSTWLPINPANGTSTFSCELNGLSCDLRTELVRYRATLSFSKDGRTVKLIEYLDGKVALEVMLTRQN